MYNNNNNNNNIGKTTAACRKALAHKKSWQMCHWTVPNTAYKKNLYRYKLFIWLLHICNKKTRTIRHFFLILAGQPIYCISLVCLHWRDTLKGPTSYLLCQCANLEGTWTHFMSKLSTTKGYVAGYFCSVSLKWPPMSVWVCLFLCVNPNTAPLKSCTHSNPS